MLHTFFRNKKKHQLSGNECSFAVSYYLTIQAKNWHFASSKKLASFVMKNQSASFESSKRQRLTFKLPSFSPFQCSDRFLGVFFITEHAWEFLNWIPTFPPTPAKKCYLTFEWIALDLISNDASDTLLKVHNYSLFMFNQACSQQKNQTRSFAQRGRSQENGKGN